jgi:MFS family permease
MEISMSTINANIHPPTATTLHGIILVMVAVLPVMAIVSLVPVMPLLGKEFAAVPGSEFLVPTALTVPALCVAIFSPFAGWLSDRIGRKRILVASLVLYAILGLLPWFLTGLKEIIVARVGLGLTEAVLMTVATAMIGDYFTGEERQRWIALQVAAISFSAIFLIAIGGALGEALGSRGPFLLYLIALPAAVLVALFLFEPADGDETEQSEEAFPFREVLPLAAVTLCASMLFYTIVVQLGPLLADIGVTSPAVIGMAGAGVNIGHVTGSFIFNRLRSWSGPALLVVGFGIASMGYLALGFSVDLQTRAAAAFFASVGVGVLLPCLLAWILRVLPVSFRGRGTGLWTGTFFFGQFLAPLAAIALSGQLGGSLINVILLYAVLAGVAAVISMAFARKARE